MNCPKCGKKVSSEDFNCIYCGVQLKSTSPDRKKNKSLFGKDKNKAKKTKDTKDERSESLPAKVRVKSVKPPKEGDTVMNDAAAKAVGDRFRAVKIAVIAVLAVVVVILVIVLVGSMMGRKGERYSVQASEYIGKSVGDLNQDSELFYADTSEYYSINSTVDYDCIGESGDTVEVQGIRYPKWAVTLKLSEAKFITDVTYTDFSVVKHDVRGVKKDGQVSLERFHDGDKQSAVLREIDMKPYSISYSQAGITTYTYKYYYKRDNGDEQAVLMRAVFTEKGKYRYSTAELLFPANM